MKLENLGFFEILSDVYGKELQFIMATFLVILGIVFVLHGILNRGHKPIYDDDRRIFSLIIGFALVLFPTIVIFFVDGEPMLKAKKEERYAYVDMDKELQVRDTLSNGVLVDVDGKTYEMNLPSNVKVTDGDTLEVKSNHGLILDKQENTFELSKENDDKVTIKAWH
ncbi:hypothetical protein ACR56S_03855 [Staphylococcus hominis]|uniref:hypothetical protein n=1 Tax=Staphylococcus hominis TaxID=1290 RepID=UPI003DA0BF33